METKDAELKVQRAEKVLDELKKVRGRHEDFMFGTIEFLRLAQSAFEYLSEDQGGHSGHSPDDELIAWVFEMIDYDRHEGLYRPEHADKTENRVPSRFGNVSVDVFFEERDGDHYYYFQRGDDDTSIPEGYGGCTVCEICETLLNKAQVKLGQRRPQAQEPELDSFIENASERTNSEK